VILFLHKFSCHLIEADSLDKCHGLHADTPSCLKAMNRTKPGKT